MPNELFRQNHAITLEQIKSFLYVYELESLSLAASASHKTQPAISHNINQLEKKLNTKLVQRSRGKTIRFTEEGHHFYRQVSPLIELLLIQIDEVEHKNTISIGVCDDLSTEIQMDIYNKINDYSPNRIRLLCDFSNRIKEQVADGRLSFAIVKNILPSNIKAFNSFYWVSRKTMNFEDEPKIAVVSAHHGCFNRTALEQALNRVKKSFYYSYISNHLAGQAEAINAGLGVGILNARLVDNYPNLKILNKKNNFPDLPRFEYECIGTADTHNKRQIKEVLLNITAALNDNI